ncbi:MAG: class I SAM-dependent methyltransferase [Clostridia bacterium]|nr:class I SAM-dependent methyltransferase [Clostridia bacterium]
MDERYTDINARAWDRWVEEGIEWGRPISHEVFLRARAGDWSVLLTPTRPVPRGWFPPLAGARVLGLASGGGQQMPIFAAAGARCTVFDYSPRQLESERMVSRREGYGIEIVRGDMTLPIPFEDARFDLIFHPVSNCYIEDVQHVWNECFRMLKPGGVLLAGLDNGLNFLVDDTGDPPQIVNRLPFNPLKDPAHRRQLEAEDCGMQFSHTASEQLGGQLRAGLRLTHIEDDYANEGTLRLYAPAYWMTRALRP